MTAGVAGRRGSGRSLRAPSLARLGFGHLVVAAVLPVIVLALLGAMLLVRGTGTPTAIGKPAPDFALTGLDGEPVVLAELAGRPTIVTFFASWCAPCLETFPLLQETHRRHADDGLAIVGVVYQDRSSAASAFLQRLGVTWRAAADPDGRAAEAYAILAPPETFLIGRDGTIAARALGQFSEGWLDEKVAGIMEE